ncbi:serine protease [Mycobacterium sp. 852002-51057_SCH5723018]|uniref:trypsin-like serine peptidase n=1 Tax=Mycobacterium sp. 852002-51057_SCH5723018 TaxID=1834094 RepID=UPI000ACCCA59|nr:hypothetical protein [Mycobacterium sp. 852002-51057_SCH5723018]
MNDNASAHVMLGPTSQHATGASFTDANGRRWIAVEEIKPQDINIAEMEQQRRVVTPGRQSPPPDPRTMSRDELAEKLQPRRLVGTYEYRLEEPDYVVADRILAMDEVPNTSGSCRGKSASPRPTFIVGPDDRRRVDSPRFFPGSANAYLSQGCTATMIGPSTALCAAHCFYNNGWISSASIIFGADTVAPTAPFGSFLADSLTLPGAWNKQGPWDSGDWSWDFAVLEFSPSRPRLGDQTGWFGTGQQFDGSKTCIGYPSDKPVPSPWVKGGTFTGTSFGTRYQHDLDIIPGDSGAGIYNNDDNRCNAIQSTQWTTSTPSRVWNEGRQWDATTYNFFHSYGNWPHL